MKDKNICDVCYKNKVLKYRINIPDGYLECCSRECAVRELKKWIPSMIEEIE